MRNAKNKMKGRPGVVNTADKPPSLPYWFLYIAFVISTLWMLVCGYFVILYGLLFEANSCTYKKFEKELCKPGDIPTECNYPTEHGCMDVTYDWLISSTFALVQDFCVNEPFAIIWGSLKGSFLGGLVGQILENWEDIRDNLERLIPF